MSAIGDMAGGMARSIVLGQVRTALPVVGGGLAVLGVQSHVNAASFEGSLYYIASSLFYIVPAIFSYLHKHSVADLVNAAIAVNPGTPEAAAIQAKVS
jgi:hypothetical protein